MIRLPRPELQNQVPRIRKTNKDEIVDSGSTRPPTGKGFGEGRRQAILRSRSRTRSPTTRSSSDKRPPLVRPRDRGDSVRDESAATDVGVKVTRAAAVRGTWVGVVASLSQCHVSSRQLQVDQCLLYDMETWSSSADAVTAIVLGIVWG